METTSVVVSTAIAEAEDQWQRAGGRARHFRSWRKQLAVRAAVRALCLAYLEAVCGVCWRGWVAFARDSKCEARREELALTMENRHSEEAQGMHSPVPRNCTRSSARCTIVPSSEPARNPRA